MYRCPNCHTLLDQTTLICQHGHPFHKRDDVLLLVGDELSDSLERFLEKFSRYRAREGKLLLDESLYPLLPCTPVPAFELEWRLRCYDSQVIDSLLADRSPQRVLDVGAWNGWLSNHLAAQGHRVTAADYFIDTHDGLLAKRFYPNQWDAVQMDLRDLSLFVEPFDVVIVNRCLQFFADPPAYVDEARRALRPGGMLFISGLGFYRHATAKAAEVAAFRQHMHDQEIGEFKPMKGYLDWVDRQRLRDAGVSLKPYPQLRLANLKAMVRRSAPWYAYGLLTVD